MVYYRISREISVITYYVLLVVGFTYSTLAYDMPKAMKKEIFLKWSPQTPMMFFAAPTKSPFSFSVLLERPKPSITGTSSNQTLPGTAPNNSATNFLKVSNKTNEDKDMIEKQANNVLQNIKDKSPIHLHKNGTETYLSNIETQGKNSYANKTIIEIQKNNSTFNNQVKNRENQIVGPPGKIEKLNVSENQTNLPAFLNGVIDNRIIEFGIKTANELNKNIETLNEINYTSVRINNASENEGKTENPKMIEVSEVKNNVFNSLDNGIVATTTDSAKNSNRQEYQIENKKTEAEPNNESENKMFRVFDRVDDGIVATSKLDHKYFTSYKQTTASGFVTKSINSTFTTVVTPHQMIQNIRYSLVESRLSTGPGTKVHVTRIIPLETQTRPPGPNNNIAYNKDQISETENCTETVVNNSKNINEANLGHMNNVTFISDNKIIKPSSEMGNRTINAFSDKHRNKTKTKIETTTPFPSVKTRTEMILQNDSFNITLKIKNDLKENNSLKLRNETSKHPHTNSPITSQKTIMIKIVESYTNLPDFSTRRAGLTQNNSNDLDKAQRNLSGIPINNLLSGDIATTDLSLPTRTNFEVENQILNDLVVDTMENGAIADVLNRTIYQDILEKLHNINESLQQKDIPLAGSTLKYDRKSCDELLQEYLSENIINELADLATQKSIESEKKDLEKPFKPWNSKEILKSFKKKQHQCRGHNRGSCRSIKNGFGVTQNVTRNYENQTYILPKIIVIESQINDSM